MTNKQKSKATRDAVRKQIKRINTWRRAGVTWKSILWALDLECVETKGGIRKALSVYGGDSTSKYQRKVLAQLTRVP